MGRGKRGSGVEPLRQCIRVRFTYARKRQYETLNLAPTPANIKAAEKLVARVRAEIALGIFDYQTTFPKDQEALSEEAAVTEPSLGFTAYSESWLKTAIVEKSTLRSYTDALHAVWQPAFAERDIGTIKKSEIKAIIAARIKVCTAKTINNNLIPLRQVYQAALDDELMEKSPLANIKNLKHQGPLPDPFNPEEMELILVGLDQRHDERVWCWFAFAFFTGVRPSEQVAVRWSDVDWRSRTIRIQRALVRSEIKGTKTNSIRDIDLSDRAMAVLQRMKAHSFMRGAESPIFINPITNEPWADEKRQREVFFVPTLRAIGIRIRGQSSDRSSRFLPRAAGPTNGACARS
ncbi:MAG: putative integrase [Bradyrhizobium sp.]|nr:putative integrase [Bradyrhizobium sp.]